MKSLLISQMLIPKQIQVQQKEICISYQVLRASCYLIVQKYSKMKIQLFRSQIEWLICKQNSHTSVRISLNNQNEKLLTASFPRIERSTQRRVIQRSKNILDKNVDQRLADHSLVHRSIRYNKSKKRNVSISIDKDCLSTIRKIDLFAEPLTPAEYNKLVERFMKITATHYSSKKNINEIMQITRRLKVEIPSHLEKSYCFHTNNYFKKKAFEGFMVCLNEDRLISNEFYSYPKKKTNKDIFVFIMSGDSEALREGLKKRKYCIIHNSSETDLYPKANFIWSGKAESYIYKHIPKLTDIKSNNNQIYNHMEDNYQLVNKKNLFLNLISFYTIKIDADGDAQLKGFKSITNPVECIPYSFYVRVNEEATSLTPEAAINKILHNPKLQINEHKMSSNLEELLDCNRNLMYIDPSIEQDYKWIVKSVNNKSVCAICQSYEEIKDIIDISAERRFLVQKYIQDVYLINQRKCKVRMFAINTSFNSIHQGYLFNNGYCRLAPRTYSKSVKPSLGETFDILTARHLTHDSTNCMIDDSGDPIGCNVLTLEELSHQFHDSSQIHELVNTMKTIISDCMKATHFKVDPFKRKNCFEILSYDFLLINSMQGNRCDAILLDIEEDPINSCFVPAEENSENEFKYFMEQAEEKINLILTDLIEETLKITLDPIIYYLSGQMIEINELTQLSQLELIYDERSYASCTKSKSIFTEEADEEIIRKQK